MPSEAAGIPREDPRNINTRDYWDTRFADNWEGTDGRTQSRLFARYFLDAVPLPRSARTLLDVGCAMGDGLREIAQRRPDLKLYGCDISEHALEKARQDHGDIAEFFKAGFEDLDRPFDIIYTSNTLEHFEHNVDIARGLLKWCKWLFVQVPYKELRDGKPLTLVPGEQHVTTFYKDSFDTLIRENSATGIHRRIFYAPGAWGTGRVPLYHKVRVWMGWGEVRFCDIEYRQIAYEIRSNHRSDEKK